MSGSILRGAVRKKKKKKKKTGNQHWAEQVRYMLVEESC